MNKKFVAFGEAEIKKHKLHRHKNQISIYNVDNNKIFASNKPTFSNNGFLIYSWLKRW